MIDSDSESRSHVNVWIGFADLFAGLLFIVVMGLAIVVYERPHGVTMDISRELAARINIAKTITRNLQKKLDKLVPGIGEWERSEIETVIPSAALFDSFGFDVTDPSKRELLSAIRAALKEAIDEAVKEAKDDAMKDPKAYRIIIEGHTDSDPIKLSAITRQIPTNWELSSRRATGVLRFFGEGGLTPDKYNIVAMGLADTNPIAPSDTEEQKRRNRRIVIRIEPDLDRIRITHAQPDQ